MTDTNKYIQPHELYNSFCQWMGVSNVNDSTYSMINLSLYASEKYVNSQYGIDTSISTVFSPITLNSKFKFPKQPTKVLHVFKGSEIVYPTITYLDSSNFSLHTESGDFLPDFSDNYVNGTFNASYLTGYVNENTIVEPYTDEYKLSNPLFEINEVPVSSPITVYTDTFTLTVIGKNGNKVIKDGNDLGEISDGKLDIDITLTKKTTNFTFKLVDEAEGKESNLINLVVIKLSSIPKPKFHVLGVSKRVNSTSFKVTILKPLMSKLKYKLQGTETVTPNDLDKQSIVTLEVPFSVSLSVEKIITEFYVELNGKTSDSKFTSVEYNTTLNSSYLGELNKDVDYIPYMPEDLKIALFKLAKHFYTGTLYGNSNVDKFSTVMDSDVSYISHTIPKDIKSLFNSYIQY